MDICAHTLRLAELIELYNAPDPFPGLGLLSRTPWEEALKDLPYRDLATALDALAGNQLYLWMQRKGLLSDLSGDPFSVFRLAQELAQPVEGMM
jgi:hypothetical protein